MVKSKRSAESDFRPAYIYIWVAFRDAGEMQGGARAALSRRPSRIIHRKELERMRPNRIVHRKEPIKGLGLMRIIHLTLTAALGAATSLVPGSIRPSTGGFFDTHQLPTGTEETQAKAWLTRTKAGQRFSRNAVCALLRTEIVVAV